LETEQAEQKETEEEASKREREREGRPGAAMDAVDMGDSFENYWETQRFLDCEDFVARSVPVPPDPSRALPFHY
jgi:hypothetical protein